MLLLPLVVQPAKGGPVPLFALPEPLDQLVGFGMAHVGLIVRRFIESRADRRLAHSILAWPT